MTRLHAARVHSASCSRGQILPLLLTTSRSGRRIGGFGRGFRRRRYRSVSEPLQEEALWRAVAASDPSGCAQKLLCLLAAERHQLQGDERLLAELFGSVSAGTLG